MPSRRSSRSSGRRSGADAAPGAPEVAVVIAALSAVLDGEGVRSFLFGAQAAAMHGSTRMSADVDMAALLPFELDALVATLRDAGFTPRVADPAFFRTNRVVPLVHDATRVPVDLVLAESGLEERVHDRASTRRVAGGSVRVASPSDLVVLKVLAGRPKDEEDVRAICRAQVGRSPGLETAYVERTLRELEEAVDEPGLVDRFRAWSRR